jgi:hypothetical protein
MFIYNTKGKSAANSKEKKWAQTNEARPSKISNSKKKCSKEGCQKRQECGQFFEREVPKLAHKIKWGTTFLGSLLGIFNFLFYEAMLKYV